MHAGPTLRWKELGRVLDQELDVLELREINVHTLTHAGYDSRLLAGAVMFVWSADRFTKNSAVVIQAAVTQMRLDFNGQHSCKTRVTIQCNSRRARQQSDQAESG